jgi:pSer/pThr/pTyr-binding forkhead associated (FHA) protein
METNKDKQEPVRPATLAAKPETDKTTVLGKNICIPTLDDAATVSDKGESAPAAVASTGAASVSMARPGTDVLLGEITMVLISVAAEVKPAYQFTFLRSRPMLFIGSVQNKCGEYAILLKEQGVGACHASIRWQQGSFALQDEGSGEATLLNGTRMVAHTSQLLAGKGIIGIGPLLLHYRLDMPGEPALSQTGVATGKTTVTGKVAGKSGVAVAGDAEGIVIAEFTLLSLDAPYALPRHCEIKSSRPNFLIGRAAHCDYRVEFREKYVAEEQALILYAPEEEAFAVKSLVRDNSIWVNSQRVKEVSRLMPGDTIRLGSAVNAPKIRFSLHGQEEKEQELMSLAKALPALQREKAYLVGGGSECQIQVSDAGIAGVVAELKVPEQGDHILVSKARGAKVRVSIEEGEVKENETRILGFQQTLHIGEHFALVHDNKNFVTPRTPQNVLLSDFIPFPQRGTTYILGSGGQCHIKVNAEGTAELLAEIITPADGDSFLVKKYAGTDVPVTVDGEMVSDTPHSESRYGINQVLAVGDFLRIRNNHRSLPTMHTTSLWKSLFVAAVVILLLSALVVGGGMLVQKYWPQFTRYMTTQNLMKQYQQNVFYIVVFDKKSEKSSSGTGFLLVQKDAYDKDHYYLVTCKHVIEPWKFQDHQEKEDKLLDAQGQPIGEYFIAVWPYGATALDSESKKYLFANSFHNYPGVNKIGEVEVYRKEEDVWQQLPEGIRRHEPRTAKDIAILELKPNLASGKNKWDYPYQNWILSGKDKLEVGEAVIVLGYSLGGGRLLNKNGVAIPASCEGKLTSDCQNPDFLEIDVNQTQGSSGGPVINRGGEIVGMVTFSDGDKKLVYAVHSALLNSLMK